MLPTPELQITRTASPVPGIEFPPVWFLQSRVTCGALKHMDCQLMRPKTDPPQGSRSHWSATLTFYLHAPVSWPQPDRARGHVPGTPKSCGLPLTPHQCEALRFRDPGLQLVVNTQAQSDMTCDPLIRRAGPVQEVCPLPPGPSPSPQPGGLL